MMPPSKFWLVWCPTGHQPFYRHSSAKAAETEAHRLPREHPQSEFFVLEAIAHVKVDAPPVVVTELEVGPEAAPDMDSSDLERIPF